MVFHSLKSNKYKFYSAKISSCYFDFRKFSYYISAFKIIKTIYEFPIHPNKTQYCIIGVQFIIRQVFVEPQSKLA